MKKEIRLNPEQRQAFERFMYLGEKYKNSYFWNDNGNASRRNYIINRDFIEYETVVGEDTIYIRFSLDMSRKNVYVNKTVLKNGYTTTARVIRTLLDKDLNRVAA